MRVKNWENFQHYKTGRGAPPWIKLYRGLLNDKEWFSLEPAAAKFLISVWILAAETDGELPDMDTIAFRLRCDSKMIAKHIKACSHWIIDDSNDMLATCYQDATPETETETETDKRQRQRHILVVFDYWKSTMNTKRAVLDDKRKRLIGSMLDSGYSSEDLCKAIEGCSKSSFHMGLNDKGMKYNGIDLIMRSAEHVDKFIGYCTNPPRPTGKQAQVEAINRIAVDEFVNSDLGGEYARIG